MNSLALIQPDYLRGCDEIQCLYHLSTNWSSGNDVFTTIIVEKLFKIVLTFGMLYIPILGKSKVKINAIFSSYIAKYFINMSRYYIHTFSFSDKICKHLKDNFLKVMTSTWVIFQVTFPKGILKPKPHIYIWYLRF